ncbi:MAG: succinate--CoA ligase subunit alpha [Candidatus Woesearchaeota archaeon]
MAVLIDKDTKVIVQGMTGTQGQFHTEQMIKYGTKIVAGVTPGKGGTDCLGIPVYNTITDALAKHKAGWSIIFVPYKSAKAAAIEALESGLNICVITEGIPVHENMEIARFAASKNLVMIGPNCPGLITPGACKIGIMPGNIFSKGKVGVVSRSGTLTYEIVDSLTKAGIGQSTVIGIGGDAINGTDFISVLKMFEKDKNTEKIVLIGEIGGSAEERAAEYISKHVKKPVIAYIAGRTAPPGKKMGHAGAIIEGNTGTAESKIDALKEVRVKVAELPSDVVKLVKSK